MLFRTVILFVALLLSKTPYSQDINGSWIGNYQKSFLTPIPQKLVVEMFIHDDSLISGLSHLYYKNNKYEHYRITGKFNASDSTLLFKEDSTLSVNLGFFDVNCLGHYSIKLMVTDTSLRLFGKWKDNSKSIFHCPTSSVWLEKKINKRKAITISDPGLLRKTDIQALIEINKLEQDSIKIEIYDNGIVDNDSISLYLNDSIIINKQMITEKPITFFISVNHRNNNLPKLKLIAESLGDIPPCTALMIISTKSKRHQVSLSSNLNSNAVIEFFLKE